MRFIILLLLLGISGIFSVNSAFALDVNNDSIDLSDQNPENLVVMGNINNFQSSTRLVLTITSPDGSTNDYDVRLTGNGAFSKTFTITNDWIHGKYIISAKYGELDLGSTSFTIEVPYDPRLDTTNTSKPIEKLDNSIPTQTSVTTSTQPSKIPEWVRNMALWYGQKTVSETEFINAIKYLFVNKIIVINDPALESVTQTPKTSESVTEPTKVFPDPNVDPQDYVDRYTNEETYRDWFHRNYPGKTIYEVVGLPEPLPQVQVSTPKQDSDPNIITHSEFDVVFSNPDNYKGFLAKISGEITQILREDEGTAYVFNTSSESFDISKRVWLLSTNPNLNLKEGICYTVEGKILGGNEAQLILTGATRDLPTIELEKFNEISCLDAKFPPLKSIKVDQTQTKGSMKVTVKEIIMAEKHTRVSLEVENLGNSEDFYFYPNNSVIIQDKRQFKTMYTFGVSLDDVESDIPAYVIEDGYVLLDPIQEKSFVLNLEGMEWGGGYYGTWKNHEFSFNINLN